MASVFQKLNLKEQSEIVVLGAPESFEPKLGSLPVVRVVRDAQDAREINFALCFVTSPDEVQASALSILASMQGDALLWFAYPKGTSHRYKSTINRDHGWDVLGSAG